MPTKNKVYSGLLVLSILCITGCAAKYDFHSVTAQETNTDYKVSLKMEKSFKTLNPTPYNKVTVYVNDQKALKGPLSEAQEGELEGMYAGKKLELVCHNEGIFPPITNCVVHLDNVRLGKYTLHQTVPNQ